MVVAIRPPVSVLRTSIRGERRAPAVSSAFGRANTPKGRPYNAVSVSPIAGGARGERPDGGGDWKKVCSHPAFVCLVHSRTLDDGGSRKGRRLPFTPAIHQDTASIRSNASRGSSSHYSHLPPAARSPILVAVSPSRHSCRVGGHRGATGGSLGGHTLGVCERVFRARTLADRAVC